MLTPGRSLSLNIEAGQELPRVPAFEALYQWGMRPRQGEVVMIAGRSGSGKSALALFWVAQMNLPTLYVSADMSAFTASTRLASMVTGDTTEEIEMAMALGDGDRYFEAMRDMKIQFSFGSPIVWQSLYDEIDAYVELWDQFPSVVVIDNLMDFDNAEPTTRNRWPS